MNPILFLFAFVLFFVLTPGVFLTLPPKSSKMMVAAVHGIIFSLVFVFTNHWIMKHPISYMKTKEGVKGMPSVANSGRVML
jgi:membrane protein CcdC involved in cytochrome C biogenesis